MSFNAGSTPLNPRVPNKVTGQILTQFMRVMDSLNGLKEQNDGQLCLECDHELVHRLVASLNIILNNGLDYSSEELTSTPMIGQGQDRTTSVMMSPKGFYPLFSQLFPQRKSIRYVNSLHFLNLDKLRCQIWLLVEISDGSIIDFFKYFETHTEIQNKYIPSSILRRHHQEVIENLELIYGTLDSEALIQDTQAEFSFKLEGEIITRYQKFSPMESNSPSLDRSGQAFSTKIAANPRGTIIHVAPQISSEPEREEDTKDHIPLTPQYSTDQPKLKPQITMKKSSLLFQNHFERYIDVQRYGKYHQKPEGLQLSQQHYLCYSCNAKINQGFFFLQKQTAFRCEFSGRWFCKACMHHDKIAIPYKAVKDFDLTPYQVSHRACQEIRVMYKEPVLVLHYFEDIVFWDDQLYNFMIMKRQLHLLYDTCCETEIFRIIPKERQNLLLTINLFSMQDLEQIKDGSLYDFVGRVYQKGAKHSESCETCCEKWGFNCPGCVSKQKIFAHDILGTQYCRTCKSLYHRPCFPPADCTVCLSRQ